MAEREELEKLLESEEMQAMLNEKYVSKIEVEKLEGKKNQLLSEKKKVQAQAKSLEDALSKYTSVTDKIGEMGYDAEEKLAEWLVSLETNQPNLEGKPKGENVKNIEDRLVVQQRTYDARMASLKEENTRKIKELEDTLRDTVRGWDAEKVENALNQELDHIDVLPTHKRVLKAAHKNLAVVAENEDGVRSVQMTTEDGLRVSAREFYESFAQSDEGKAYIAAPTTSGGGAIGGKGTKQVIDFGAERNKALQDGNTQRSVSLGMTEWRRKQQQR